ncbi:MAG: DUF3566 domain-containing protein [Acidobacteriota bacterium]
MSKTERDLDREIDALEDELDDELDAELDDALVEDERVEDESGVDESVAEAPVESDDADDSYELPEIIMATEGDEAGEPVGSDAPVVDPLIAREADDPEVSDDVLEELRRAEIDGPTVALAPQDDTSSSIRRPRRSPDYDPAPYPIPMSVPRMLGRKPRVRRVTRVVRHVDPWSVFKIAIVANIVLYLIVLTAGVLLWNVAYATGTVDNVERFFESFGWSSFEFNGGEIYHNAWIGGLFVVIGLTGLAVLLATLFNLITDLVGGMRFTVLEEEVVEARPSPMRRFVVRRAEPEVPHVSYDQSGPIVREAFIDDTGGLPR